MASKRPLVTGTASVQEIADSDWLKLPPESNYPPTTTGLTGQGIQVNTNTAGLGISYPQILMHDSTTSYHIPVVSGLPTVNNYVLRYSSAAGGSLTWGSARVQASTSPTISTAGDIGIDTNTDNTNITDASLTFHDGTRQYYVTSTRALPTTDGHVLKYNGTSKQYEWGAVTGGSGLTNAQVLARVWMCS